MINITTAANSFEARRIVRTANGGTFSYEGRDVTMVSSGRGFEVEVRTRRTVKTMFRYGGLVAVAAQIKNEIRDGKI